MSNPLRSLAALFVTVAVAFAQSPVGDWTGAIEVPGSLLGIHVKLTEKNGAIQGTIDIPDQGATDLPLTGIDVKGNKVAFAIAEVPGDPAFAGELSADGKKIAGKFTQGSANLKFSLERDAANADAAKAMFAGMAAWLDESRAQLSVPGCAVAVVKGGDLVTTFGSGFRDVEHKEPVTADTLFAIGSSTKAFTTFVLATLAEEGKFNWDEPLRRVMPDFALADESVAAHLTPRDLVTHRSGMPRHDLVWYGSNMSRAEMVARLKWLPLNHDLRTDFQYNNLMFLTAGHLAERLSGRSWEELVQSRILQPLGMQRTNFSVADSQRAADHAEPYRKDGKEVQHIPFRDISAVGPAGSINSSVREMANWVSLHLQNGKRDGRQLLSAAAVNDLHQPRMPMGERRRTTPLITDVGYALGWFVDVYRGHRRVHHGGNIDGFSAMVMLLPDDGYGFVVLTNLDGTPCTELVARNLCDRVLGLDQHDWRSEIVALIGKQEESGDKAKKAAASERKTGTVPSHALADFAGDYSHPGYGPCHVELRGERLHVDFHGIGAPMEHWHYDVFRCLKEAANPEVEGTLVQFGSDLDGEVDTLRAILEPNTEAITFTRQADKQLSDPAFLAKLAGQYDLDGQTATFTVQGNILVLTLPGQRHELVPQRGLVFRLAKMTGYSARFVVDDKGEPVSVRFRQPEGVFEAKRKPK